MATNIRVNDIGSERSGASIKSVAAVLVVYTALYLAIIGVVHFMSSPDATAAIAPDIAPAHVAATAAAVAPIRSRRRIARDAPAPTRRREERTTRANAPSGDRRRMHLQLKLTPGPRSRITAIPGNSSYESTHVHLSFPQEIFHARTTIDPAIPRRVGALRQVRRGVQAHPVGHRSRRDSRPELRFRQAVPARRAVEGRSPRRFSARTSNAC